MPYASLGEFLAELQDQGELVRIAVPVDSALELAAITDRMVKSSPDGGPALLFENVRNTTTPIVTNLLGSRRRLAHCLGVSQLSEITATLDQRIQAEQSTGWVGSILASTGTNGLNRWSPKTIKTGACQQVVKLGRDIALWDLPVPRCWPEESSPVITAGQIVTKDFATGAPVYFQSPLAITAQQELAWYDGHQRQNKILKAAADSRQNLPVAIALGGDPVLQLAADVPGIDDTFAFAGLLRGAHLELVRCRTSDLEVPAGAEVIIEGYIDASNPKSTFPISIARGNGRYMQRQLPLVQVTAVTHRANPVFPAKIISTPPSEESWIAVATECLLLPILKRVVPNIVDIHQPFASANRNLLFVGIRKTAEHDARRILHALWGTELVGQTKVIVIVDADLDLRQEDQVWFRVGTHACPQRDFLFADGLARDDDYTSLSPTLSGRVGIDATRKENDGRATPWPLTLKMSDDILTRIRERWHEYRLDEK
jgi:4-hydroxy-3-polyprenylbenzoate decarboxylase